MTPTHWSPLRPILMAALLAPLAPAQTCTLGPPTTLGTVALVNTTCNAGAQPRTTCRTLRVECAGLQAMEVRVRVTEPDPGVALRGTVVLGTGGGGNDFYSDRPGGPELFASLRAHGFRCVERAWTGGGWFSEVASMRKQACRYATLLTWIHANVHTKGAFVATGNSGGSAEIGYALTAWGRGDILDVAVPSGGPPMSRLDYLCGASSTWNALCRTVAPRAFFQCGQPGCTIQPGGPVCTNCTPNPTAADLEADSILFPGATLAFPRTRVHVVLGGMDCSSAVPAGFLFFDAIATERALEVAPDTPHWTPQTQQGRDAILRAILGGTACRGAPATIHAPAWPPVGGTLALTVHGPPGGSYGMLMGAGAGLLEFPPLGFVFLDLAILVPIGSGALDPATGRALLSLTVPNDPALAGVVLYEQALAGLCLSNLSRVQIQR